MSVVSFRPRSVNQIDVKPLRLAPPDLSDPKVVLNDLHTIVSKHVTVFRYGYPAYFRWAILGYGLDPFAKSIGLASATVNVELWAVGTHDSAPYHQFVNVEEIVLPPEAREWGLVGEWTYREGAV